MCLYLWLSGKNPCAGMSCGALCLPNSTSTARCSCPSYGGKVLKSNNQCVGMYITEAVIVMHDCRPHYIIYDNYADSNYTSSQFLIKQLLKLLLLPLSHLSSSSSSSSFVFFLPLLRFCCSSDTTFCTKISGFLTWCFGSPSLCSLLRFFQRSVSSFLHSCYCMTLLMTV